MTTLKLVSSKTRLSVDETELTASVNNVNPIISIKEILKKWNCLNTTSKDGRKLLDILLFEGYNTVESLTHLTSNDLEKFKIKNYDIKRLLNNIQSIKNNNKIFNSNSTINIPSNIKFKDIKIMKNPYVIIIGISDYRELDESGKTDLLATINDTKCLKKLFTEIYGYKHVVCIQDFIDSGKNEKINVDNLEQFLRLQKNNIDKIFDDNNTLSPDGLLFFYSGHGKEKGIKLGDGDTFEYKKIQNIFSNQNCKKLGLKPKCLFFDCCRGCVKIRKVSFNSRNIEEKNDINNKDDRSRSNSNWTNKYNDIMITYSTVIGTQSFDNKKNGHMIMSIYCVFKDLEYMRVNTLHKASLKIKTLVHYHSKHSQTCECVNRLDYDVKLLPNNGYFIVKPKYLDKLGELSNNEFENMYWLDNDKLGKGSFSKVIKITRKLDHKACAIKLIGLSNKELFNNEIKALELCNNNSNIMKLLNYVYNYKSKLCLILEYCNGGSVLDKLNRGDLSERGVADIIKQVCNGLKYIHSNNIVHRDIKPNNLMYYSKSRTIIKIIDFGLAGDCSNGLLYKKCGTLAFMAPEILRGVGYNTAVDIWSLGVSIFLLLSKSLPFSDVNNHKDKIINLIISGDYAFKSSTWNFVTKSAVNLIQKLLTTIPKKRLTASDILNDNWVNGTNINIIQKTIYPNYGIINLLKMFNLIDKKTTEGISISKVLDDEGYTDFDDLKEVTMEELLSYKFSKIDAKKLLRKIKQLQKQNSSIIPDNYNTINNNYPLESGFEPRKPLTISHISPNNKRNQLDKLLEQSKAATNKNEGFEKLLFKHKRRIDERRRNPSLDTSDMNTNNQNNNNSNIQIRRSRKSNTTIHRRKKTPVKTSNNTFQSMELQRRRSLDERSKKPSIDKRNRNHNFYSDETIYASNHNPFKVLKTGNTNTSNIKHYKRQLLDTDDSKIMGLPNKEGELTEKEFYKKYWIEAGKLGEGTFARVRKITRKHDKIPFALKVVKKTGKTQEELIALNREISILHKISHSNIVKLTDWMYTKKRIYMVIEYCSGGTVMERILKTKKINELNISNIIKQVCKGLEYLHSKNIVHRDIRPDNFMYKTNDSDSVIKIIDFGLSGDASKGPLKTPCGTLHYIAPEILSGIPYNTKVDMWSLGVSIYLLLCGFPPFFEATGNQKRLHKLIRSGRYRFPSPYWDYISKGAKDLIRKLLVKDPKKRLSATQCLQHSWVGGKSAKTDNMSDLIEIYMQQMRFFTSSKHFTSLKIDINDKNENKKYKQPINLFSNPKYSMDYN